MATGTVTVFEEAKAYMLDCGWEPTDEIWIAIIDDTVDPLASHTAPELADYTQVTDAGPYVDGGLLLDTLGDLVIEAGGVMTFDTTGGSDNETPSWAQDGSNATDAYWGVIYNDTDANDACIAFVELGGPVNMTTGSLTITWHTDGIFTIT